MVQAKEARRALDHVFSQPFSFLLLLFFLLTLD